MTSRSIVAFSLFMALALAVLGAPPRLMLQYFDQGRVPVIGGFDQDLNAGVGTPRTLNLGVLPSLFSLNGKCAFALSVNTTNTFAPYSTLIWGFGRSGMSGLPIGVLPKSFHTIQALGGVASVQNTNYIMYATDTMAGSTTSVDIYDMESKSVLRSKVFPLYYGDNSFRFYYAAAQQMLVYSHTVPRSSFVVSFSGGGVTNKRLLVPFNVSMVVNVNLYADGAPGAPLLRGVSVAANGVPFATEILCSPTCNLVEDFSFNLNLPAKSLKAVAFDGPNRELYISAYTGGLSFINVYNVDTKQFVRKLSTSPMALRGAEQIAFCDPLA